MKYTKEQRLDIGRRIYYSEISRYEAAEEYGISEQTARNYMRMYRDANRLPPKRGQRSISALSFKKEPAELDELKSMTKEELIQELIKARITEARFKKRIRGEGRWYGNSIRQQDYQVIMELSGEIPVKILCKAMGIQRSSFYAWKKASLPIHSERREEPCKQCQAVSRIPLEVSVAWLPLAECQDTPRQKHCPV